MSDSDIYYECKYCGHKWKYVRPKVYTWQDYDSVVKCIRCGDKDLIKRKIEKIDYYADPRKEST